MKLKITEIAELVNGKIIGDFNLEISRLSNIQDAQEGDLTFLYMTSYNHFLSSTKASAILINKDIEQINKNLTYIIVDKPNIAFQNIIIKYFSPEFSLSGIHPTAVFDENVKLGNNTAVGVNVYIGKNSCVGENSKIYHNTVVLENCIIGKNVMIFPNVTIRENSVIGNNVIIHSGTVIGSDGFGFTPDDNGVYHKIPQIGNVVIEDDVEIGSNVSIDRAAIGSTIISKGVKLDNLIQIAHNVKIGKNTVMSAQSGVSGSTKIGENCIFGGQAGATGHIEIADKVLVGAQTGISKSITKPGTYFGSPAQDIKTTLKLAAHNRMLPEYAERIKKLEEKIAMLENESIQTKGIK
ncbi:MAG: UDP-3-O-(3-hydroxymyristoyl)glucosamine N-acyltransferase [Ignavibacteriales bacterium]|nr:UDP-3-O-(3-hydroxymyristoyl)glucosamine N-acyltransferase [Ignavibacteriales bacterium]